MSDIYCAQSVQLCAKCFNNAQNQNRCRFCDEQKNICTSDSSQVTIMCKKCYDSSKVHCQDCGRSRCIVSFCPPCKTIVIIVLNWKTYLAMEKIIKKINKGQLISHQKRDDYLYYHFCV
jgi:hypothetical protein